MSRAAPITWMPLALCRDAAAETLSIGTTMFDELVKDGKLPKPKRLKGRVLWDSRRLAEAWDAIEEDNDWGNAA